MKRIKMSVSNSITLEQGCNEYLDNCRARNLSVDSHIIYT